MANKLQVKARYRALSNAVYHRSYEIGSPMEVQVFPDSMTILSHPGPVPPVNAKVLASQRRIIAREYRNRRVGDFLKELKLTEGRGTGIPTIYKSMEENGSPAPSFDTDELNYVLVTLPVHTAFERKTGATDAPGKSAGHQDKHLVFESLEDVIAFGNQDTNGAGDQATNQAGNQATNQATNQANEDTVDQVSSIVEKEIHSKVGEILENSKNWIKRKDLFKRLDITSQSAPRKKYIDPLLEIEWLQMEFPDRPTHPAVDILE